MKCKACNTWNVDSAKYCRNCGKSISAPKNTLTDNLSSANTSPSPASNSSSTVDTSSDDSGVVVKWIITIVLIILGIALLVGGYTAPLIAACAYSIKKVWDY